MEAQHPDLDAALSAARAEGARERLVLNRRSVWTSLMAVLALGGAAVLERCQEEPTSTAEVFQQTLLPPSHK